MKCKKKMHSNNKRGKKENHMKKFLKHLLKFFKNKTNIILSVVIVVLTITMLFYETQKEGFNEDEMFSYGSSNYKYDNLYQPYGPADGMNTVIFKYVLDGNWFANIVYCVFHSNVFYYLWDVEEDTNPIWKTKEDAMEYLTIQPEDIFDFAPVIWNQSRDVHPPLFYILVHIVSSFFLGQFSKYIIFIINIVFYILTCIYIFKIFKLYKKEKLGIVAVLLYGLSIGAISTVMFQRMYMMMTFFVLWYTYICIKIVRHGMTKKLMTELSIATILGFLTQYYFCLFAAVIFAILFIHLKGKRKTWIWENVKLAILGIAIFPASIYHIFFSYRGIGRLQENYFERLKFYVEEMFREFSINSTIGYILLGVIAILLITYFIKLGKNKRTAEYAILAFPVIIYYLIISKTAPYLEQRYILPTLPLIVIGVVLLGSYYIGKISKKKIRLAVNVIAIFAIIILQTYGLITKEPDYLYKGYKKYIELAKEYQDYQFVYVGINGYNHIKNMPEFAIYKESLILNETQLELLKERDIEDTFIVGIKLYLNVDEVLKEVLEYTGANNYELVLEGRARGFEANYYLVSKNL